MCSSGGGAERVGQHRVELRNEPRIAVVVVEHEDAVVVQVLLDRREGLEREQERLEPDRRLLADKRQRVGQGKDDQVVLLVRRTQECPAVVVVCGDARVAVRVVGVLGLADLEQLRVDLDRVYMACAVRQRDGHI